MELETVTFEPEPLDRLASVLDGRFEGFVRHMRRAAERLRGRTIWSVNSTAHGGGVAEMLASLLPYASGAGWDVRWVVVGGDPEFFRITKGIHNALHGAEPASDVWAESARRTYADTAEHNASALLRSVRPGDVVLVHDPQAAGLIRHLVAAGVHVSWQCHVGTDTPNEQTRRAWSFLGPFVRQAARYVFSREAYLWEGLERDKLLVIPPSIDALSPKNAPLAPDEVSAILGAAGVIAGPDAGGSALGVRRRAERVGGPREIPADARIVLEVSRWDGLKDPLGFLRMYADHLSDLTDVHLVYAGPSVADVDDDPEGAEVLAACSRYWESLPSQVRDRIHLLSIPMEDGRENALIVNALQRRADVVVQKSLQEGFGLTVTEAMWKGRPVVASRVGGIQDQIEHGRSGLLVDDPHDLDGFAGAVRAVLADTDLAQRLGDEARRRVEDHYLHTRQLQQYADLALELAGT